MSALENIVNWFDGASQLGEGAATMVMVVIAFLGCSTPSTNGESEPAPPIESQSEEVQQEFDRAVELLEDGYWEAAVDEFRLLQGQYTDDATAEVAELYIARGLLGDIDESFELQDQGEEPALVDDEVFSLLEPLAMSEGVDDRIRYAAQVYLAAAHALEADIDEALLSLEGYPGGSLSPKTLDDDRRWLWPLVAEGLHHQGRDAESVVAWAKLHALIRADMEEGAQQRADDAGEEPATDSEDWFSGDESPPIADLAVSRAFETEGELKDDELRDFIRHDLALVRAVGVWTLLRGTLDGDTTYDDDEIAAYQEIFNDLAPDFLAIGAADRASELSVALAAVSGPERLVIGALLPLTGPNRAVGYRALAGMLIAQRSFHAAGEPAVTLVIEDSHSGVEEGYRRLVDEGAVAVVGPLATSEARQLVEPAGQQDVPVLAKSADRIVPVDELKTPEHDEDDADSDDEQRADRAPVYRNFVDALAEARAAAHIAFEELGDRRAAAVYPDMGYGRVLTEAFVEEFRSLGGEIVADIEYERDASDYVDLASRIAESNPEAIFLPDTGAKVAEISAFFAQEQIWGLTPGEERPDDRRTHVHYLGTSLWQAPIVIEQADSYLQGALIPAWYSPQFQENQTRQFAQVFEAIYGTRADQFVAFSYDSVNALRQLLLERGVTDGVGIERAFAQDEWYDGATGRFRFGEDGEPHRELRYLTIDDGQWEVHDSTVMTPIDGRRALESELEDEQLESIDDDAVDEDAVDEEAIDEFDVDDHR